MAETTYSFPEDRIERTPLPRCPDCGGPVALRLRSGEHSVHLKLLSGRVVKVDCQGRVRR
jgi:hypothetical protein